MIGDFNLSDNDDSLNQFKQELNLENVVKVPTCFKSDSPTCIELILTSDKRILANIGAIETGLSDFHAKVATTLKGSFHKKALGFSPTEITVNSTTMLSERRLEKS